MKSFSCVVIDANQRKSKLILSGSSQDAVVWDLNRQGYLITSISELSTGDLSRAHGEKISANQVLEVTKTLHVLMANGLGLKDALQVGAVIFGQHSPPGRFLEKIGNSVAKGQTFAQALEPFESSLGSLYVGLVRVGERAGGLTAIFEKLADYLQVRKQVRDKILGSLLYPAIVLGLAIVGLGLLTTFVLPVLFDIAASLQQGSGRQFRQDLNNFRANAVQVGVGLAVLSLAVVGIIVARRRSADFSRQLDRLAWRLPLSGAVSETLDGLYFCFAMETLLLSGYSLEQSLAEAVLTVRNRFFKSEILQVRQEVLKGTALSKAMAGRTSFSKRMLLWIRVGEQAGELAKSFSQLRTFYQQAVEKGSARLMSLAEPILILVVGVILIVLIGNVITPIFGMLGGL